MAEPLGRGPWLLLTTLGLGRLPRAPGTVASAATALLVCAAGAAPNGPAPETGLFTCAALCAYGVLTCLAWGGIPKGASGKGDPGWVVADEVAGQALASVPAVLSGSIAAHLLAFLLFRLLDITKPPPVRQAERWGGGLGVLADDLVAGALAAAITLGAWQAGVLPHPA